MSEIEGIKDFVEANKSSLENMNKEMLASYGQIPLVWLTLQEAKDLAITMFFYHKFCQEFLGGSGSVDDFLIKASKISHTLDKRIKQASAND